MDFQEDWGSLINENELLVNDVTLNVYDVKSFSEDQKSEFYLRPEEKQGPPARGDFAGDYNFFVHIKQPDLRKKYEYSESLTKVYINLCTELPVQFSWDWARIKHYSNYFGGLVIRATLQFADQADAERRPVRCLNHMSPQENINRGISASMLSHILQSVLKDGKEGVEYCGNVDNERSWLSVTVRPPTDLAQGVELYSHTYKFMCKNSCVSGINRRAIEVAFTLEDTIGSILGRQTVGIRVCSCPRRDMGKDEDHYGMAPAVKRPRISNSSRPSRAQANKVLIKTSNVDLTPVTLNFTMLGKKNSETILNLAMNLLRADSEKLRPTETNPLQTPHDNAINAISQLLHSQNQQTPRRNSNVSDTENHK